REYIDCGASFGVGNLGHCNPAIVEAIARQAQELIHVGPSFGTDAKAAFVEKLLSVAPRNLNRVFLSNSGSEAVEAAIKFARAATGRTGIVAAMRGFHGRTMGALSATWRREFREPFEPLVPGFRHVPFNDVEALAKAVDGDTAAVILEAVQGEGGVHVASPEYLPAAREACARAGILSPAPPAPRRSNTRFEKGSRNARSDSASSASTRSEVSTHPPSAKCVAWDS